VRTFRVDNPHTKPLEFWQWLIREVQDSHPDVIFLSEAFTRPKVMKALAKAGFSQSYTYFTWRNFKQELTEYFEELTRSEMAEYFRGNLFCNTPDILPEILQRGGPSAFKMRAALAATLSPLWGIYSGFELCESEPVPGTEEYLDSEKYQIRVRDWDRPGHIKDFVARLNRIRRENPALQTIRNVRFYQADSEHVLFYGRMTETRDNVVLALRRAHATLDPGRGVPPAPPQQSILEGAALISGSLLQRGGSRVSMQTSRSNNRPSEMTSSNVPFRWTLD
jgi:starch synthase (maltosyl-transferring)